VDPLRASRERITRDLAWLVSFASMGGSDAEVGVQDALVEAWRAEDWSVADWDIDIAALASSPDFPGMEVARTRGRGALLTWAGTGGGRRLLFNAHTDVVPPGDLAAWSGDPFTPRIQDVDGSARMIGRGTCDMKAGLVAAWEAMRCVREAGITLAGDVLLAPVSGEEDGGLGTYALLRHGLHADACVIPEPTDLAIVPANGGALTFRLRVPGRATHASRRTAGTSAIEKFVPVLDALSRLEARRNADVDPVMARWPVAYPLPIGTVHAGDWASTVPDLLVAEGRLGVALGESADEARASLEEAITLACAEDLWLRDHPVVVEWWGGQFASGSTDVRHPLLTWVGGAHKRRTGDVADVYGAPYGSDLRLLSGLGGIPTIQYGPGDSAAAHAPDEWVDIDDVVTCAEVLTDVIIRTCSDTV
jgi:acetylornithine deacetylase